MPTSSICVFSSSVRFNSQTFGGSRSEPVERVKTKLIRLPGAIVPARAVGRGWKRRAQATMFRCFWCFYLFFHPTPDWVYPAHLAARPKGAFRAEFTARLGSADKREAFTLAIPILVHPVSLFDSSRDSSRAS